MMDACQYAEAADILEALQALNRRRDAAGQEVDTAGEQMMRCFATTLQSAFFQVLFLGWQQGACAGTAGGMCSAAGVE
jgi:hypothetical protein